MPKYDFNKVAFLFDRGILLKELPDPVLIVTEAEIYRFSEQLLYKLPVKDFFCCT